MKKVETKGGDGKNSRVLERSVSTENLASLYSDHGNNSNRHKHDSDAQKKDTTKRLAKIAAGMEKETEEGKFIKVLDMLEAQDEFDSTSNGGNDANSTWGSDDSDWGSSSDEEHEEVEEEQEPLLTWELEAAWVQLTHRQMPPIEIAEQMLRDIIKYYNLKPSLIHVPRPEVGARLIIVGDLHGHFGDFMHIMKAYGEPQLDKSGTYYSPQYVFNGDFVDRGAWGPEVLLAIYCLKLLFPDAIHLNRGNHEDREQNNKADNGFCHSHCTRAWGAEAERLYNLCYRSFKVLPLCTIVGNEIAVVHGGLPLDTMLTLQEIADVDRKHAVPVRLCGLLGYPRHQKVIAKHDLLTENGETTVAKGTAGRLSHRCGKAAKAVVRFHHNVEAEVRIRGAPELEDDIEIVYANEQDRQKNRDNRIFVGLLWSDPVEHARDGGPSFRGAGAQFSKHVTQEFLKTNHLRLLIRSHEKQPEGFREEQFSSRYGLLAATVFSASNYPSGAGEPNGNMASVIIVASTAPDVMLSASAAAAKGWRTPYASDTRWHDQHLDEHLRAQVREASAAIEQTRTPRVRVLAKLRGMIYCARPKLLNFWRRLDKEGTGHISLADWTHGMRACIIPEEEFPWEWLAKFILHLDETGSCNYTAYLARYENPMALRLAKQWHGNALTQLAPGVSTVEDAEAAWARLDKNGLGRLTHAEVRPMLRESSAPDEQEEEDRVFSVLQSLDKDMSGSVERDEFVNAIMKLKNSKSDASRKNMRKITRVLESSEMSAVQSCWAATQGTIRALSTSMGSVASVFQVLSANGDGRLERIEFEEGMQQLLRGSPVLRHIDKWSPILWQLVDDGSGYVSADELCNVFSVKDVLKL